MSYDVDLIRGSSVYRLSDGQPFWAMTLTGLGLPPVRLIKERSPQQNGSTVVGSLLDERLLNLALLIDAPSEAIAAQYRRDLAHALKPIKDVPCTLRITANDGTIRQIDAYTVGTVDFPNTSQDRFAGKQQVIVQFEAPDPIPYDPTLHNITFDNTAFSAGFLVPMAVPLVLTVPSAIDSVVSLTYSGDWETFPFIYLTGPMNSPIITNETTGDVLDFTGASLTGSDIWEIDLRYGKKRIADQNGTLKNAALTDESDLITWSFVPDPEAPGGINDIRVNIPSGVTSASRVRVTYYDKYPTLG
jgi:hypothetical protein